MILGMESRREAVKLHASHKGLWRYQTKGYSLSISVNKEVYYLEKHENVRFDDHKYLWTFDAFFTGKYPT